MSDFDSEEERVLTGARRAWSATGEDAERVLRGTQLAIFGLATTPVGTNSNAGVLRSGAGKLVAAKWLAGMLVAVLGAGSGGYALGYRAGERASRAPIVQRAVEPLSVPPLAAAVTPASPAPPAADASVQPTAAAKPTLAQHVSSVPSLQAETRVLRKVERALRDGRPALALRLLATLDRSAANGPLAEERFAAWAVARCAQSPEAERSREFSTRYPGSVYGTRVEQACLGVEP